LRKARPWRRTLSSYTLLLGIMIRLDATGSVTAAVACH
jgi:hypothetical protein